MALHSNAFAASRAAVVKLCEEQCAADVVVLDAPAGCPQHSPGYFSVFCARPGGSELEYVFTRSASTEGQVAKKTCQRALAFLTPQSAALHDGECM